jgi:hypothetical protein
MVSNLRPNLFCWLFGLWLLGQYGYVLAQQQPTPCGIDQAYRNQLTSDSLYRKFVQSALPLQDKADPDTTTLLTIPVVFVVYHLGETVGFGSNVSDAALQYQLDLMNDMFAGKRPHYVGPDARIRFVLARRSQACGAFSGIARVDARSVPGYQTSGLPYSDGNMAMQLRNLLPAYSNSVSSEFVTIRVVHQTTGASAWAYYGGDVFMPSGSMTNYGVYSTLLTHEMGHALFLEHTFNGSLYNSGNNLFSCPTNDNPETDGDRVADTDPHRQNEPRNGCDAVSETLQNSCTGRPFGLIGRNFMSYGCELRLFTRGQINRMRSYLTGSLNSLLTSPYLNPPADGDVKTACQPNVFRPATNYRKGISRVQFQTIDKQTNASPFQFGHYWDFTCTDRTLVTAGQTYSLVVEGFGRYQRAYIDYNDDGTFDEATERVWTSENGSRASITIPTAATMDRQLRLRVIVDDGPMPPTACSLPGHPTEGSGEVEDYAIRILPADTPRSLVLGTVPSGYLCQGKTVLMSYMGTFGTDNRFTVELSNESGSFDNPTPIGSGAVGPIAVTLPASVLAGGTYRVRVVSSNPVLISNSSQFLRAGELPTATISGSLTPGAPDNRATLSFSLTGSQPWTINFTKNGVAWGGFGSITQSPFSFTFVPASSGIYELTSVSNVCGVGTTTGSTTLLVPCTAPTGLFENRFSLTVMRMTWNMVWDNTYTLQWREATATTWNSWTNVTTTGWLVSGLEPGKTYRWRLKRNCLDSDSDWSEERAFVMDCPTMNYLSMSEMVYSNSAQLSWGSFGDGFRYTIRWRTRDTGPWTEVPMNAATSYSLTGLTTGETYQWQIQTHCGPDQNSAYSEIRQFSPGCSPPFQLSSYYTTPTSIGVSWVGSSAGTYELRWRPLTTPTWTNVTSLTNTYYFLPDLPSNETYLFQVRAVCSSMASSAYSNQLSINISCPVVDVGSMDEMAATSTTVQVRWFAATDSRNQVRWRPVGSTTWQTSTTIANYGSSYNLFYSLTGLTGGTTYEWQVQTLCGNTVANSASRTFVATCRPPAQSSTFANGTVMTIYYSALISGQAAQLRWRPVGTPTWTESVTTTSSGYTIFDLTPGLTYEWQIRSVCSPTDVSPYSPSTLFLMPCPWPNSYTTQIGPTTARFTWVPPAVSTYDFRWRLVGATTWNTATNLASPAYSLTGLTTGSTYEWQVRTVCSSTLASDFGTLFTFTANCRLATNLTEITIAGSSAQLYWTADSNGATAYTLQWRPVGSTTWESSGTSVTGYPAPLTGLTTGTTYEWRVLTDCEGTLTPSASRTFTAQCGPLLAGSLYAYGASSGGAQLSWSGIYGFPNITYRVRFRPAGTTTWTESTTQTNTLASLTGLANNTAFEWQVQTICNGEAGPYSTFGPSFTTVCITPTAYPVTPGDVVSNLNWTYLNNERFALEYRVQGDPIWITVSSLTASTYYLTTTPATAYEWRVRTSCSDGSFTAYSNIVSFTSLPACDANEPNDSFTTATPVSGTSFTLTGLCLNRPGDQDWFRLTIAGEVYYAAVSGYWYSTTGAYRLTGQADNGTLTLTTASENGSQTDTYLVLYAADGITSRLNNNNANGTVFSQLVYTLPPPCSLMTTVKNGAWTDPTVWSCNRQPVATDSVLILHEVSVYNYVTGRARQVQYGAGGKLRMMSAGKLLLGQ